MASRYWVGGGTNNQWNSSPTSNFSATSGGAPGASNPTSTDDVIFDGVGVNANGASQFSASTTVLSLTFSGYSGTITINTAQTLTIAGNFTDHASKTWVVSGTGKITLSATCTITSAGVTFPGPVTFSGSSTTKTLSGNWTISGLLTQSGGTATTLNKTTSETLTCGGGITNNGSPISGTAKIIVTGGTISAAAAIQNSMDIQGTVTISAANGFTYNTGTLTAVGSPTVTTTGSTLTIGASTTLNTAGITWNNITSSANSTLTINSLLSATGTYTINAGVSVTFAGTSGFTVGTLTCNHTSNAGTQTFNDGVTYTITNAFNCNLSRTGLQLFTSDDATNTAALTLSQGATCNVLANFTRINASGGRPILTFNGTVTASPNVFSYSDVMWKPVRGFGRGPRKFKISNRNKAVEYL